MSIEHTERCDLCRNWTIVDSVFVFLLYTIYANNTYGTELRYMPTERIPVLAHVSRSLWSLWRSIHNTWVADLTRLTIALVPQLRQEEAV